VKISKKTSETGKISCLGLKVTVITGLLCVSDNWLKIITIEDIGKI